MTTTPTDLSEKSPQAPARALKGVFLAAAGLLLFACMDTTTKYLTLHYNVPFVVAMRYWVHCALMIAILAPRYPGRLFATQLHTRRRGLVLLRALALVTASLFIGLALQRMPLAETTAITFLAPMLVVLLASPALGEKVGALGWIAVMTGFAGVLLIARPGGGLDAVGIVFGLFTAGANATYQLLSRVLARTERTVTLLFYTALVGSLIFGLALPWSWPTQPPSRFELLLFLCMGLAGGLGHYFFTQAYRYAPASILAPVVYLQLFWAVLLGWLVFDSTPDTWSMLGMTIVVGSGVMIAFKSSRARLNQ